MINFGCVSMCYKVSWAQCSYKRIAVSPGNQRREVQIEAKPRPEGYPLSSWTKRKFLFVLSTLDCRCLKKRDQKKVKKQFVYPKHISQMITEVCAVLLRTFSASDATSDATLSSSELRKLYPDTVFGEISHVTLVPTGTLDILIIQRSILF